MDERWWWLAGGLAAVNLWGFVQVAWDKRAARRRARRVPEARLITPVWLGGPLGVWLGMRTFRHKTVKRSFQLKLALASIAWLGAVAALVVLLRPS